MENMLPHWTHESVVRRCFKMADDYGVRLHVAWKEGDISADNAYSSGCEGDGDIYMLAPEEYSSLAWFALSFLHELSHMIVNGMCRDAEKSGQYGLMMKNECLWRHEFWCWNNAIDLGRSIFGIRLNEEMAGKIVKCLSSYINGSESFANFYYAEEAARPETD